MKTQTTPKFTALCCTIAGVSVLLLSLIAILGNIYNVKETIEIECIAYQDDFYVVNNEYKLSEPVVVYTDDSTVKNELIYRRNLLGLGYYELILYKPAE